MDPQYNRYGTVIKTKGICFFSKYMEQLVPGKMHHRDHVTIDFVEVVVTIWMCLGSHNAPIAISVW